MAAATDKSRWNNDSLSKVVWVGVGVQGRVMDGIRVWVWHGDGIRVKEGIRVALGYEALGWG